MSNGAIDATYVALQSPLLANGPEIELRNTSNNVGLRLEMYGDTFQAIRVHKDEKSNRILIEPQTTAPGAPPLYWLREKAKRCV